MLLREDPEGPIIITQPAHAWICGQMARLWGNDEFGAVTPYEEVRMAAEQHDIGWITVDEQPRLNPETGLPHTFLTGSLSDGIEIWQNAPRLALSYGRYVSLLVSKHGTRLYGNRLKVMSEDDPDIEMVRIYLERGYRLEQRIIDDLHEDSRYDPHIDPEIVDRNMWLIATWDALSLSILQGMSEPKTFDRAPDASNQPATLTASIDGDLPEEVRISPWPFSVDRVPIVCDGRRIAAHYENERELHAALDTAEWITLRFNLIPAE